MRLPRLDAEVDQTLLEVVGVAIVGSMAFERPVGLDTVEIDAGPFVHLRHFVVWHRHLCSPSHRDPKDTRPCHAITLSVPEH